MTNENAWTVFEPALRDTTHMGLGVNIYQCPACKVGRWTRIRTDAVPECPVQYTCNRCGAVIKEIVYADKSHQFRYSVERKYSSCVWDWFSRKRC